MIYLDYAATTPVDKQVLKTFIKVCTDYPANSNSLHKLGIESKELEDYATNKISNLLNLTNKEIIYTSGASESNNQALKGVCLKYQNRGHHIITTYLEHSSITATMNYLSTKGFTIDYVKLDENGQVDLEHLKQLLTQETILVSICAVDSELGIVQPLKEISTILKDYPKCIFHSDCTQALGKIPIDFNLLDLASASAHKIYGLKGIGLLIKNKNLTLEPLIHGGKSTTPYRSGTPALPLIVSTMQALSLIIPNLEKNYYYIEDLNKKIITHLKNIQSLTINSTSKSLPHTINISLSNIKPETFLHALDEQDIYISTKSACSEANTMSDAVYAVTKNRTTALHSLRISLSHLTTTEEIDTFLKVFDICYNHLNMEQYHD